MLVVSSQNWVHDPKLTNDSEVKACVKLRFKSRDGKRMLVSRYEACRKSLDLPPDASRN